MGWPKGRLRRAEQGNAAPTSAEAAIELVQAPELPAGGAVDLETWVSHCEDHFARCGAVVVALWHPECEAPVHRDGRFSGFQITPGDEPGARGSDGSVWGAKPDSAEVE